MYIWKNFGICLVMVFKVPRLLVTFSNYFKSYGYHKPPPPPKKKKENLT